MLLSVDGVFHHFTAYFLIRRGATTTIRNLDWWINGRMGVTPTLYKHRSTSRSWKLSTIYMYTEFLRMGREETFCFFEILIPDKRTKHRRDRHVASRLHQRYRMGCCMFLFESYQQWFRVTYELPGTASLMLGFLIL